METQEPVALSPEQLERIAESLREPSTGTRRGRPRRRDPEPVVEQDVETEADPLVQTLTKERLARGLTLETVAKRMGVTVDKLELLESGTLDARLSVLRAWSKAVFMDIQARSTKPGKGRVNETNFR